MGAADSWRAKGRARFERELTAAGVAPDEVATILDKFEDEVLPSVDLDEVLRGLKERLAQSG
jgi:hypothetical protein